MQADAQSQTKTWTDTPEWSSATSHQNITWTDVQGQIQLVKNPPKSRQTPFIYIPHQGTNTVTQLDTKTGKLNWTFDLKQLRNHGIHPDTGSPSRTTVDANGHVWLGMRFKMRGSDAYDYADGVVWISMQGKLKKVVTGGLTARAITVDIQGNVWIGYWRSNKIVKLDGKTGNKVLTVNNIACPYGAVADIKNNIWIVNNCKWDNSNTITKLSPTGKVLGKYPAPGAYGIATDVNGQVWTSNWPGGCLHRFNNSGQNLGCIPLNANPRGLAIDGNNNVWVACSHNGRSEIRSIIKLTSSGKISGRYTDVGRHSIGVAVDADGYVWVVSFRDNIAAKIRVSDGKTVGKYPTGGVAPYTYSDMTGFAFQSLANPAQGYWRAAHSTPCLSKWSKISWNGSTPAGTSITVRARSAATKAGLASASWNAVSNGAKPNVPDNPWIEVEVAMRTFDAQITPYVTDVTVVSDPGGTEICNGKDDNCNGLIDEDPNNNNKPLTKPCTTACGKGIAPCRAGDWSICSARYPTPEVCNGLDDDCDGKVDDDAQCGGSALCSSGACALRCIDECPSGQTCVNGVCKGKLDCSQVKCDAGKICRNGSCVDPCFGIVCPQDKNYVCKDGQCIQDDCYTKGCEAGKICKNGACVANPCANRQCPAGQACKYGNCVASCAGVQCPQGQACKNGKCEAEPCAGVNCGPGKVCNFGQCQDDPCANAACRGTQVCIRGQCVDDPCTGVTCPVGQVCRPPNGDCFGQSDDNNNNNNPFPPQEFGSFDGGSIPGLNNGGNNGGNNSGTTNSGSNNNGGDNGGTGRNACVCSSSLQGGSFGSFGFLVIGLLLFFIGVRRRR